MTQLQQTTDRFASSRLVFAGLRCYPIILAQLPRVVKSSHKVFNMFNTLRLVGSSCHIYLWLLPATFNKISASCVLFLVLLSVRLTIVGF